jgi:hypothetical protein
MRAAKGHIWLWHLPPHPVRADRRDAQPEVGGNLRGCPPLRRRVRHRLVDSHTSIVAAEYGWEGDHLYLRDHVFEYIAMTQE